MFQELRTTPKAGAAGSMRTHCTLLPPAPGLTAWIEVARTLGPKAPPKSWPNVRAPPLTGTSALAFLPEMSLASWTVKTGEAERAVAGAARAPAQKRAAEEMIMEAFILMVGSGVW